MPHPRPTHRATPFARIRLAAGLLGVVLAATAVPGLLPGSAPNAGAEGTVKDGSDWGSQGTLSSDSPVTVRWDNVGNPETSIVRRDRRQVIPHTGGKTYDDISSKAVDAYTERFGADNGLGGLKVTVAQTRDITNQAVTVDIQGAAGGGITANGTVAGTYLQVFQCWGGLDDKGAPDPGAAEPDPATCQVGPTGADSQGPLYQFSEQRNVVTDPLIRGGDWAKYDRATAEVPFTSITGELSGSDRGSKNQFFNKATTNEWSAIGVSTSGTATRAVELQTSVEAPHLGCGKRADEPSTDSCWLVIVPRLGDIVHTGLGPISPSVWAQRLQVKLDFAGIAPGCPSGQSRALIGGSELITSAAASWTPGLCAGRGIALGYSQLSDGVARNQLAAGSSSAVLTSEPAGSADTAHVPVALTAPVIALTQEITADCRKEAAIPLSQVDTEAEARDCGFADLAAARAEQEVDGHPVLDLRLNARLVAKLLTQTYRVAVMSGSGKPAPSWISSNPRGLARDPEFRRLNPQLENRIAPNQNIDHIIVEGMRSDAATAVWNWILADPQGRAFLNGCPDPDGLVINPFYSTRTYEGCTMKKDALDAQATKDRDGTDKPEGYVDGPQTYPSDGSPYPLPGWQEWRADGATPRTVVDWLPRTDVMATAGRNTFIGSVPQNSFWCATVTDSSCTPAPGKWKDPKVRQPVGQRAVMSITDAATAAKFRLATAKLCNTAGDECVGADTRSLREAAEHFVDTDTPAVQKPGRAAYGDGAYPLTMPVYAAVKTDLDQSERTSYADAMEYLTTAGQKQGFGPGELPPGYAPLTDDLRATAQSAIATIRSGTGKTVPDSPSPTTAPAAPKPTAQPSATTTPPAAGGPAGPGAPAPAAAPVAAPAAGEQLADTQLMAAPAGHESWPSALLPLGLVIALLSGLAGPLLRLRSRFTVR